MRAVTSADLRAISSPCLAHASKSPSPRSPRAATASPTSSSTASDAPCSSRTRRPATSCGRRSTRRGARLAGGSSRCSRPGADRVAPACAWSTRCGGCDWMHLSLEAQGRGHVEHVRAALPPRVAGRPGDASRGQRRRSRTARARGSTCVASAGASMSACTRRGHTIRSRSTSASCSTRRWRRRGGRWARSSEGAAVAATCSSPSGRSGVPVLEVRWDGEIAPVCFGRLEQAVTSRGARGRARRRRRRVATGGGRRSDAVDAGRRRPAASPRAGRLRAGERADERDAGSARRRASRRRSGVDKAVELYAGAGNLSVLLAREVRELVLVESSREACDAARANLAAARPRERARRRGRRRRSTRGEPTTRLVVLDPPRTGARAVAERLAASRVPHVVYVACDAADPGARPGAPRARRTRRARSPPSRCSRRPATSRPSSRSTAHARGARRVRTARRRPPARRGARASPSAFACDDCAHFDAAATRCSLGYPAAPRRDALDERARPRALQGLRARLTLRPMPRYASRRPSSPSPGPPSRDARLLIPRGRRVLVAVSGGPDSMALLHVLARSAARLAFGLFAHGVDHGLRPAAAAELDLAADLARSLEVPFARSRVSRRPRRQPPGARPRRSLGGLTRCGIARRRRPHRHRPSRRRPRRDRPHAPPPRHRPARPGRPPPRDGDRIRPFYRARRADIDAHVAPPRHPPRARPVEPRPPLLCGPGCATRSCRVLERLSPRSSSTSAACRPRHERARGATRRPRSSARGIERPGGEAPSFPLALALDATRPRCYAS